MLCVKLICNPSERTHDKVANMRLWSQICTHRVVGTGVDLYIINYCFYDVYIDQRMFFMIVYGLIRDAILWHSLAIGCVYCYHTRRML